MVDRTFAVPIICAQWVCWGGTPGWQGIPAAFELAVMPGGMLRLLKLVVITRPGADSCRDRTATTANGPATWLQNGRPNASASCSKTAGFGAPEAAP